jgi:acetyl esterase/lipase
LLANLADRKGTNTLSSSRYGNLKNQIYQPVRTGDFAGYWICRGFSPDPIEPRASDLVIYYLHGGGYVAGHPADNISDLLFIAESLAKRNLTSSIFSLDYTLAPRASFPKQVEETAAAYEYLVNTLKIDPSKLVLMGESAGAHLALSFLTNLHLQSINHPVALPQKPSSLLPKPAMAILVSPWIDLLTSNPRAKELEKRDFLSKSTLDLYSSMLLRTTSPEIKAMHGNFGTEYKDRGS